MLLPNAEANIVANSNDLSSRISQLGKLELKGEMTPTQCLGFQQLDQIAIDWTTKLAAIKEYETNGNDICLLRSLEIGLNHLRQKNHLALRSGNYSYSIAATAIDSTMGSIFGSATNFFRHRGIEKQRERLAQLDILVTQLEGKYKFGRLLSMIGLYK